MRVMGKSVVGFDFLVEQEKLVEIILHFVNQSALISVYVGEAGDSRWSDNSNQRRIA